MLRVRFLISPKLISFFFKEKKLFSFKDVLRGRWKATSKVSQIAVWCETTVETLWTTAGNLFFIIHHARCYLLKCCESAKCEQKIFQERSLFVISRGNALIDLIFVFQLLSESTTERLAVSEAQPSSCRSMVWTQTPPGGHSSHPSERRRHPPSEHKDTLRLWTGGSCWPSLHKN